MPNIRPSPSEIIEARRTIESAARRTDLFPTYSNAFAAVGLVVSELTARIEELERELCRQKTK